MVITLDSGSSGPGSSPGRRHCNVFLGKTLYSHSASLHPGVQMDTSKYAGVTLYGLASHPGGSSNTRSRFVLRKPELSAGPMDHLDLYKGFTFFNNSEEGCFSVISTHFFLKYVFMYTTLKADSNSTITTQQTDARRSISSITRIASAVKRAVSVGAVCIGVTVGKFLRTFVQICRKAGQVCIKNCKYDLRWLRDLSI